MPGDPAQPFVRHTVSAQTTRSCIRDDVVATHDGNNMGIRRFATRRVPDGTGRHLTAARADATGESAMQFSDPTLASEPNTEDPDATNAPNPGHQPKDPPREPDVQPDPLPEPDPFPTPENPPTQDPVLPTPGEIVPPVRANGSAPDGGCRAARAADPEGAMPEPHLKERRQFETVRTATEVAGGPLFLLREILRRRVRAGIGMSATEVRAAAHLVAEIEAASLPSRSNVVEMKPPIRCPPWSRS